MTQPLTRAEMQSLIVQRAWKDEAFRSEFIADPKGTIEKYSGQKLPAELNIVALAEDEKSIHFVIPQKPANASELTDDELEKVAGGIDAVTAIFLIALGGTALSTAIAGAGAGTRANHGW